LADRHRTVGDAQQKSLADSITALSDADKLPTAEWMEGVGYADKMRRSGGNVCNLS
jgi:hypothetical protein